MTTQPVSSSASSWPAALSPREAEILLLRAQGYGNKEVADQLGLSQQTVKNYAFSAYKALDVTGIVGAMWKLGWVTLP
jgi:DNA-binding NarL/FixJ family response regulator